MQKIVTFNKDNEVASVIENVISVTPYLEYVEYVSEDGIGKLEGFENGYIIVDQSIDPSTIPYEEVIEFAKQLKIKELSEECNAKILEGFEYNGDYFDFDYKDQTNFYQQLALLSVDPTIEEVSWKTRNNGIKTFTRDEFIAICKAAEAHKKSKMTKYWFLRDQIINTQYDSISELKSIHFE